MTTQLPQTVAAYIRATNNHDASAFIALFADWTVVNDVGREFRGLAAIKAWSDREIFDARVTLEVLDLADRDGETIVTTKVDGNFDRTGLPDPVVINHHITVEGGKIVGLTCRLAGAKPGPSQDAARLYTGRGRPGAPRRRIGGEMDMQLLLRA